MVLLEFEKPIGELQDQLDKVKQIADKSGVDVAKTFINLEERMKSRKEKIEAKKKEIFENLTPWQRVQLSRHPERPYTISYINSVTDNTWIELYGDRNVKDDKAMVGGFGSVDGRTVMFIGQQKGINTK